MNNDLQRKIDSIFAGATRTDPLMFVQFQMSVKSRKHFLDLLKQAFQVRFFTRPVKENGISLYFAYLQIQMIAIYNYFKQFLHNVLAVHDFRFRHTLSEAAYIRHK